MGRLVDELRVVAACVSDAVGGVAKDDGHIYFVLANIILDSQGSHYSISSLIVKEVIKK